MDAYEPPLEQLEPVKKPRGCFFYGCVTAICLSVVFLILMGLAFFGLYRMYNQAIQQYTSTSPMKLPPVELSEEGTKDLDERVDAFKKSLDTGEDVKPLILTPDEINVLIAKNPEFQNRVHVEIPGDKIQGQVSIPLDKSGLPGTKGRYLNGKAAFKVTLSSGQLFVTLDALEVNGQAVPEQQMMSFRNQNLAADFASQPENAKAIEKLESIEVKDGKLIIKPRPKAASSEDEEKKGEAPKSPAKDDDEAKPKEETKGDSAPPSKDAKEEKAEPKAA